MAWKFSGEFSVSKQIADRLRADILNGVYAPGSQFPTVRSLALEAAVNPNTVQKAMTLLESEGLLSSTSTAGRFVTEDRSLLLEKHKELQECFLKETLSKAKELNISKEQMIRFINEQYGQKEDNYE